MSRVEHFHKRLDALDINYANHLYEIEGASLSAATGTFYELKIPIEGKQIRYTLDNSEPGLNTLLYESKIPISGNAKIKAAVFNSEKQLGRTFAQTINYHKAVDAKITINKEPHQAYQGSGAEGLINGISGSDTRYGDKEWLGFWGDDITITIFEVDIQWLVEEVGKRVERREQAYQVDPELWECHGPDGSP